MTKTIMTADHLRVQTTVTREISREKEIINLTFDITPPPTIVTQKITA